MKIKTSSIFFGIGIFVLVILLFMFAVPQSQFDAEAGPVKVSIKDISEPTVIILFTILVLVILIGFIAKFWFENKKWNIKI